MKAIETKYHGPTNARGSRVSARDMDGNRVILSWDYALDATENHAQAARALVLKMGWTNRQWIEGGTTTGHVFVPLNPRNPYNRHEWH